MRRIWLPGVLILAACQPQDPTGAPAVAPADAPAAVAVAPATSDFSQPMTAIGTEPFWSLAINGVQFKLSRPGEPNLVATAPGAVIRPGLASWSAMTSEKQTLAVRFQVAACSDGMSDRTYPMTAEVDLGGSVTLKGCAVKTAEMPPEGGTTAGP